MSRTHDLPRDSSILNQLSHRLEVILVCDVFSDSNMRHCLETSFEYPFFWLNVSKKIKVLFCFVCLLILFCFVFFFFWRYVCLERHKFMVWFRFLLVCFATGELLKRLSEFQVRIEPMTSVTPLGHPNHWTRSYCIWDKSKGGNYAIAIISMWIFSECLNYEFLNESSRAVIYN